MLNRLKLQTKLEELLGCRNVYFQPPSGFQLKFPCIIYELGIIQNRMADNKKYHMRSKYKITLIDDDPDNSYVELLLTELPRLQMINSFKTEGYYHYIFELYLD